MAIKGLSNLPIVQNKYSLMSKHRIKIQSSGNLQVCRFGITFKSEMFHANYATCLRKNCLATTELGEGSLT